ncbi:hypothetical protein [Methylobacterium persicinum]|uniref:Uncharacterized protein n=1 Tax=Methylobacterium persicinum TaxID=374426 RepID=A0ABU0HQG3_9HYPH|nr:hypothetical protein [Methylobacterium persicinum]MDQ0444558.1 hypothetical protein [Methylobacterium persicinum]GJE40454.1 hypothetical protein KHHGKMAE_4547 [Methylobacterium persicinum]
MTRPIAMLHEDVAETGDLLDALYRLLRQTGVFDGEAGDAIHTLVTKVHREVCEVAERLDPIHVSIIPAQRSSQAVSGGSNTVLPFQPPSTKGY